MIRVEHVRDLESLQRHEAEYRALVGASPGVSVFDSYEWLSSWLAAYWPQGALRFLFFREGERLLAAATLLDERTPRPWCSAPEQLSALHPHGNGVGLLCAAEPGPVLQALLAELEAAGARRLVFPDLPAHSPLTLHLPSVARIAGLRLTAEAGTPSPIVRVCGSWEDYLRGRAPHLPRRLRQKERRLQKAGRVTFVVVSSPDDCERALRQILDIERRSWKAELDGSLTANPRLRSLHEGFAHAASRSGLLRLYLLFVDERPVAFVFGAVFRGELYALKTSYDEAFRELSPGAVLFSRFFGDAFAQGLHTVDLGPGNDGRWKREYCDDLRPRVHLCLHRTSDARCVACGAYRTAVKPFVREQFPALVAWRQNLLPRGSR